MKTGRPEGRPCCSRKTGSGDLPSSGVKQFEFDFAARVYKHPDLDKLLRLDEAGLISRYDAPILKPLVVACRSGNGVGRSQGCLAACRKICYCMSNLLC